MYQNHRKGVCVGGGALTNTVFSKEVSIGTRIMEGLCVFVSIFL